MLSSLTVSFQKSLIGDSRYDCEMAQKFSLDFLFLSSWSDMDDWNDFVRNMNIISMPTLEDVSRSC